MKRGGHISIELLRERANKHNRIVASLFARRDRLTKEKKEVEAQLRNLGVELPTDESRKAQ